MKSAKVASPVPPPSGGRIVWHANTSIPAAKRGAVLSLLLSLSILALGLSSVAAGDTSLFTLLLVFIAFYFIDTAVTRLRAAVGAPTQVGIAAEGLHVRTRRGDEFFAWADVRDVRSASVGGRMDSLRLDLNSSRSRTFKGVPQSLSMEVKLAWLAASTQRGAQRARVAKVSQGVHLGASWYPVDLEPTAGPQYWDPVRGPTTDSAPPRPAGSMPVDASQPDIWKQSSGRPAWSYTRIGDTSLADPRYPAQPAAVPAFTWHFIPPSGTRVGGVFLVAVLILAGIAISRLVADLLLSFAGLPSDPWIATAIGLGIGVGLAVGAWRVAKDEIAGEVAGSVIFLPTFDRTKAELLSTLRDAAAGLGAGVPRERRRRARMVLVWPQARTRATVMQASYDTRAIVLKTVGRSNYALHADLKSAILDRLRPKGPRR